MDSPHKKFPWLMTIVIVIIVLALIQWFAVGSGQSSVPGLDNASSTPSTASLTNQGAAAANAVSAAAPTPSVSPVTNSGPTAAGQNTKNFMHTITVETNKGTIVFQTYDADAPATVTNFITLAQKGFYNSLVFHRVIQGFMIQGGDPTGTGMGGPGYSFADELNAGTPSYQAGYVRGTVAMANSGPNTNGSQFFIMQKDTPLPHNYTIFGKVVSGMDVVDAIAAVKTASGDKPVTPVVMNKVTVATNQ